ncbi:MAG TPA: methyltransferase domain-containing protein [Candidatus Dormibacteraeota bacterium]|nr:methyltransferase domain-containing protein [Candidatus Dormibacteraeota bacterium]
MSAAILRRLLAHPLTASLAVDDPLTTGLRRKIILSKPFLRAIYDEWYRMLARELPPGAGQVLELGSGGGYCARFIPDLITSEVFPCSDVQIVVDAQRLPFPDRSMRAIIMTNVMHHVPNVRRFFAEATRCLCRGGKILMIEPWVTWWSRLVYRLHSELFCPEAGDWSFSSAGHLSGANVAIPWIVFHRDRGRFESEFRELSIEQIRPFLPFRYLVSGGVGMRNLMPGFAHSGWAGLERMLESQMSRLGMFAFISVRRL